MAWPEGSRTCDRGITSCASYQVIFYNNFSKVLANPKIWGKVHSMHRKRRESLTIRLNQKPEYRRAGLESNPRRFLEVLATRFTINRHCTPHGGFSFRRVCMPLPPIPTQIADQVKLSRKNMPDLKNAQLQQSQWWLKAQIGLMTQRKIYLQQK